MNKRTIIYAIMGLLLVLTISGSYIYYQNRNPNTINEIEIGACVEIPLFLELTEIEGKCGLSNLSILFPPEKCSERHSQRIFLNTAGDFILNIEVYNISDKSYAQDLYDSYLNSLKNNPRVIDIIEIIEDSSKSFFAETSTIYDLDTSSFETKEKYFNYLANKKVVFITAYPIINLNWENHTFIEENSICEKEGIDKLVKILLDKF